MAWLSRLCCICNGKIQIGADMFLGNIEEFKAETNKALSKKHLKTAKAEKYKQAALECFAKLEEIRRQH